MPKRLVPFDPTPRRMRIIIEIDMKGVVFNRAQFNKWVKDGVGRTIFGPELVYLATEEIHDIPHNHRMVLK